MKNLHFSDLQTKIIERGAGVSVEHYNACGRMPICTVYWRKMIFKPREQPVVARSNDWWQLPIKSRLVPLPPFD